VVGYAGGATLKEFGGANSGSLNFYRGDIKDNEFENPLTKEKHRIGIIAVSGGHRTPYSFLETILNGGQTIGRSYTEIPEPNPNNFMNDLRQSLRSSTKANMVKESIIAETLFRDLPSRYIGDKVRKALKKF
ncbi:MAG: hypothetical protein AABX84_00775, partial [Nanoarchaeota archaeon]